MKQNKEEKEIEAPIQINVVKKTRGRKAKEVKEVVKDVEEVVKVVVEIVDELTAVTAVTSVTTVKEEVKEVLKALCKTALAKLSIRNNKNRKFQRTTIIGAVLAQWVCLYLPTILQSRVRIPNTPYMLLIVKFCAISVIALRKG